MARNLVNWAGNLIDKIVLPFSPPPSPQTPDLTTKTSTGNEEEYHHHHHHHHHHRKRHHKSRTREREREGEVGQERGHDEKGQVEFDLQNQEKHSKTIHESDTTAIATAVKSFRIARYKISVEKEERADKEKGKAKEERERSKSRQSNSGKRRDDTRTSASNSRHHSGESKDESARRLSEEGQRRGEDGRRRGSHGSRGRARRERDDIPTVPRVPDGHLDKKRTSRRIESDAREYRERYRRAPEEEASRQRVQEEEDHRIEPGRRREDDEYQNYHQPRETRDPKRAQEVADRRVEQESRERGEMRERGEARHAKGIQEETHGLVALSLQESENRNAAQREEERKNKLSTFLGCEDEMRRWAGVPVQHQGNRINVPPARHEEVNHGPQTRMGTPFYQLGDMQRTFHEGLVPHKHSLSEITPAPISRRKSEERRHKEAVG